MLAVYVRVARWLAEVWRATASDALRSFSPQQYIAKDPEDHLHGLSHYDACENQKSQFIT